MIGAKNGDYGYDVFLIYSRTIIKFYIRSIGWREYWLRKILVILILINKLYKNLLSSSFLFPKWRKMFHIAHLLHTYARLLKVVGNWSYTLVGYYTKNWIVSYGTWRHIGNFYRWQVLFINFFTNDVIHIHLSFHPQTHMPKKWMKNDPISDSNHHSVEKY
jgi:hypothetical protein